MSSSTVIVFVPEVNAVQFSVSLMKFPKGPMKLPPVAGLEGGYVAAVVAPPISESITT